MKNNMVTIYACSCTYKEGKLYCLAKNFNLIFSVDLQDERIELIDAVPDENILSGNLFGDIKLWNNKLILSPWTTQKVCIYDMISKQWESFSINEYEHQGFVEINQMYIYNDFVYMIGSNYPAILCLNLENNTCDYIEGPYKEVKERHPDIDFSYFRIHGVQLDNFLYLASCLDNYVLKFDMDTREYQWIEVGNTDYIYSQITWDGSNFWLAPRLNCDIVKWDGKNGTKIIPLPSELKKVANTHAWYALYDGSQVVFPCLTHPESIIIDIQKDSIQIQKQQYTHLCTRLDNGMVVCQTPDGILSVKTDDQSAKTYNMSIDSDRLKEFYEEKNRKVLNNHMLYQEARRGQMLSMENYITFTEKKDSKQPIADSQTGKKIWEKIK